MSEILVKMPIKTVSEGNIRGHWSVRHKRRKKQREDFALLWKPAYTKAISLPCRVTFTRYACQTLDAADNLNSAFKAVRDELAAILGIDDGDERISFEYEQVKIAKREHYFTVRIINL